MTWWRYRRVVLNLRCGRRHLQIWLWGARVLRAEDGADFWALQEFLWWRP